jgi:hypothetical protein
VNVHFELTAEEARRFEEDEQFAATILALARRVAVLTGCQVDVDAGEGEFATNLHVALPGALGAAESREGAEGALMALAVLDAIAAEERKKGDR